MKEIINFFVKVTAVHVITYVIAGAISSYILNYEDTIIEIFGFKPMNEIRFSTIIFGQITRGFLPGIVIWWIKDSIIGKKWHG